MNRLEKLLYGFCYLDKDESNTIQISITFNENFEEVLQKFKFDKEDFTYYLYELEIRLMALRDIIHERNCKQNKRHTKRNV